MSSYRQQDTTIGAPLPEHAFHRPTHEWTNGATFCRWLVAHATGVRNLLRQETASCDTKHHDDAAPPCCAASLPDHAMGTHRGQLVDAYKGLPVIIDEPDPLADLEAFVDALWRGDAATVVDPALRKVAAEIQRAQHEHPVEGDAWIKRLAEHIAAAGEGKEP